MENGKWDADDIWLLDLIKSPSYLHLNALELSALDDAHWWTLVAESVNGLDAPFIRKQFASMSAWLIENPRRRPTPKGWKKFMRGWLERGAERERKATPTQPRRWR